MWHANVLRAHIRDMARRRFHLSSALPTPLVASAEVPGPAVVKGACLARRHARSGLWLRGQSCSAVLRMQTLVDAMTARNTSSLRWNFYETGIFGRVLSSSCSSGRGKGVFLVLWSWSGGLFRHRSVSFLTSLTGSTLYLCPSHVWCLCSNPTFIPCLPLSLPSVFTPPPPEPWAWSCWRFSPVKRYFFLLLACLGATLWGSVNQEDNFDCKRYFIKKDSVNWMKFNWMILNIIWTMITSKIKPNVHIQKCQLSLKPDALSFGLQTAQEAVATRGGCINGSDHLLRETTLQHTIRRVPVFTTLRHGIRGMPMCPCVCPCVSSPTTWWF